MPLTCRFYEQRYPEIDEVVMVNVRFVQTQFLRSIFMLGQDLGRGTYNSFFNPIWD